MLTAYLIDDLLERAFREDLGLGDLTTVYSIPFGKTGSGRLIARETGTLAGINIAARAFSFLDQEVKCSSLLRDGETFESGSVIMTVSGSLQAILSAERVALNFVQRLSGIATKTAAWVKEIGDSPARLTDTRKTTPGLRIFEKYAVLAGGGSNHRLALDGGILIKENHIAAAGGIGVAIQAVRRMAPFTLAVEVEVTNLSELQEAIEAGADIVMLDNMGLAEMREAVNISAGRVTLEASGNVTFERLKEIAAVGVDYISCGALTHSVRAIDFSFLLDM